MRTISPCFHILQFFFAILWSSANADALLGRRPAGTVRPLPRNCRARTTPPSARPGFRIGLSRSLMSVDRSSRTHGPARAPPRSAVPGAAGKPWARSDPCEAGARQAPKSTDAARLRSSLGSAAMLSIRTEFVLTHRSMTDERAKVARLTPGLARAHPGAGRPCGSRRRGRGATGTVDMSQ